MGDNKEVNVNLPMHLQIQEKNLKAYSNYAECPICGTKAYTISDQICNPIGILSCVLCSPCWGGYLIYNKKDLACYDSNHSCISCKKEIASYKACI